MCAMMQKFLVKDWSILFLTVYSVAEYRAGVIRGGIAGRPRFPKTDLAASA